MIALGVSPLDKDSTITLMDGGKILFAASEERFSRKKLQDGFPIQALHAGLGYTGIRLEDIDVVAYPFFDSQRECYLCQRNIRAEKEFLNAQPVNGMRKHLAEAAARIPEKRPPVPGLHHPNERMSKGLAKRVFYNMVGGESVLSRKVATCASESWASQTRAHHKKWQQQLEDELGVLGLIKRLRRYDHHLAHAAAGFFSSGFERALVVTLDGYGSGLAGSVNVGEGVRLRRLHRLEYPHSLGTFYESVTSALGFQPGRHEGKIVGLAAYGNPAILLDVVLGRFCEDPGNFRILESNNSYFSRYLSSLFPKIDVAAAYQRALEIVATRYIEHYVRQTGIDAVVLAGGVAANVKLNQRIFEIPGVERIFIYPNMGDGGCGTGAAFLASLASMTNREPYENVYFGPDYSDSAIREELLSAGLEFQYVDPIEPVIARLIHGGHVVARFTGRMEYGPRALGNRSILYRASEPEVNHWLNERLGRTEFMPFAPVTLFEERSRCYKNIQGAERAAEFMTITFDCTEFMRSTCPAAVHVDGTARPQLVREETNPSLHRVLREYKQLSGVPSIINTSFNMHEEPIVNSPRDAVRAFLEGRLDYLAAGNFLVVHPSAPVSHNGRNAR